MSADIKGWIDIKDEMPDADIVVLIACRDGSEPVWLGFFDGECWREVSADRVTGVTHWRDLPDPPEVIARRFVSAEKLRALSSIPLLSV